MSDTQNKLQYRNNYNHSKILDLALDLNYVSYSNPNPTNSPKHQAKSSKHQFSQRIWYIEYYSVHAHMAWSQRFPSQKFAWHFVDTNGFVKQIHFT